MRNPAINAAILITLSPERLSKYLVVAANDLDGALSAYERNTRLSEAFYSPLQAMEVCLRNVLHREMSASYGLDWLTNGQAPLDPDALQMIGNVMRELNRANAVVSPGTIVAELSFGFWVGLLGPRYDATIWRGALHRAFRPNGRGMNRRAVHGRFNALRRFRNRIAHHEPIFQLPVQARHAEVVEAIEWMSPETAAWAAHHSRFLTVFAAP